MPKHKPVTVVPLINALFTEEDYGTVMFLAREWKITFDEAVMKLVKMGIKQSASSRERPTKLKDTVVRVKHRD